MTKQVLGTICAMAACTGFATTYHLKAASTGSGTTAFKDASFWVDDNGDASGAAGATLDSTADYEMGYSLRQGRGTDYAHFGGASLRIGVDGNALPYLALYYNEGTSFDKLYLTSGYLVGNRGHDFTYYLDGDIEVDAAAGNDFHLTLSYTNSAYHIRGSLSSSAASCLALATMSPCYSVTKQTGHGSNQYGLGADESWHTFIFDTDMSQFLGKLRLDRTSSEQLVATPTMWQIKARFPTSNYIPGSVEVPGFDALALDSTATLIVGDLSLAAGSMLEYDIADGGGGSVSVSGSLALSGPVVVHLKSNPSEGAEWTLLSAPDTEGNSFSEGDFTLVQTGYGIPATLSVVTDGTTRRLVATCPRWIPNGVVTLETSDVNTKEHKASVAGSFDSALTNGAQWSSGRAPESGYSYYVGPTASLGTRALRTRDDLTSDTFPGDALIIGTNCILFVMTRNYTVNDLRMYSGSLLAAPNTGSFSLYGNLSVPWGSVRLRQYASRTLSLCGKVTGAAELALEGWAGTASPNGYYDFTNADMSGFKGTIRITEHPTMAAPDYNKTNQTLRVNSAAGEAQLGAKLDEFNPKALTLERYATLALTAGSTLNITTNSNRGIYVNGNGRITVQSAWHTMNITTRLTVDGALAKNGDGRLVLGGECVALGDSPSLDIMVSNVVVSAAGAIDGLTVNFSPDTRLGLKVNLADGELTRCGIRNTASVPFVLADGMATLPLELEVAGVERPDSAIELGLVTVSAAAADSVEALLPAPASPFRRMNAERIRKTDPETDAVTFALRLTPIGTFMVIR